MLKKLNVKTVRCKKKVIFQAIQFSISTQFSSIWPIDRIISGATNRDESGPESDSNEGFLFIPQSSSITGTSPPDCLVSYQGQSLKGPYPYTVGVFYSPNRLGKLDWVSLF